MILVPSLQVDECVSFRFYAPNLIKLDAFSCFLKRKEKKQPPGL